MLNFDLYINLYKYKYYINIKVNYTVDILIKIR